MVFTKHNAVWYARRYPKRSPLRCMISSCNREIKHGETYESTYHGRNAICKNCYSKELLVYQPKRGNVTPHNKVGGFKKCGENSISSYRHQG